MADVHTHDGNTNCGFVALIGAPNAGKSTLLNGLVGSKVSIISHKVQTTRALIRGIAVEGQSQLIFVDTPGIFSPRRRLDRAMVTTAWSGAHEADLVGVLIDSRKGLEEEADSILARLGDVKPPKLLILNKVDLVPKEKLLTLVSQVNGRADFERVFMISATTGDGVADLKGVLAAFVPEGPWHFPEDQVSDATDRMLAAEVTREQLYHQLHAELPYESAIETEKFEERADGSAVIHQQILVARASQKAIVLGKGGTRIRAIGEAARKELSTLLGRKVHLFLHVKVNAKWEEDRSLYREIGLDWVE